MPNDELLMAEALELARSAPFTSPNPRVGVVLERDGQVIGRSFHEGAGHPHAEQRVLAGADAAGATMYATLEPCVHHGRTPPCAPAVVEAGVARVVVATTDPDPRVAGGGLDYLRANDVEVVTGVLEAEARALNAAYIHHRSRGRPLLTLKLALTLDGRLAARDGSSRWITGVDARKLVHRRRSQVDAVLVGAGTVLADDPSLDSRGVGAPRQPVRVVADARGIVPAEAKAIAGPGVVIVATTDRCSHEQQTAYKERGAEVVVVDEGTGGVDLAALMRYLGGRGFLEVLCEGGAELATALLTARLVDRLELFYGAVLTGGGPALGDIGVTSLDDAGRWVLADVRRLENDVFCRFDSPDLARLLAPAGEPEASDRLDDRAEPEEGV